MPTPHPLPPKPSPPVDDDSLDELPPMDGEDDDEHETPAPDLEDDELLAADEDPFDDATGEGDVLPELDVSESETGWLADAVDDETLDVGAADLLGGEETPADKSLLLDNEVDERAAEGPDLDLDDEQAAANDAGEEGPEADDEALREEDLPSLDADADGEGEDDSFFDELPQPGDAEPFGDRDELPGDRGVGGDETRSRLGASEQQDGPPPWSKRGWDAVGARPTTGAVHALACATRGILAAGRGISRVDLEGAVEPVAAQGLGGGELTGLCFDGALLVAATEHGGVFVSRDAGATFVQANGWRERVSAHEAASGLEVVLGSDEMWGRTAQGKLLFSVDQGASWESADVDGFVLTIAVDDKGKLVALTSTLGGAEVVRGSPGALETSALAGPVPEVRPGAQAAIAARGSSLAFAVRGAAVRRSLDGHAWSTIPGTRGAADLEFIDGAGTLLVAVVTDGGDAEDHRVWLVRAPAPAGGEEARVVASLDVDHAAAEGAIALAWDEAHGVVWLGGAFGLSAFQPALEV